MTEERRVVTNDPVDTVETAPTERVVERPTTRTVVADDPVGNAFAASQLIQTVVWSVVVLVLLVVALWALHVYAHLF
ncbi:MAG: hypothetical protein ACR2JC_01905 [Chloroflexota bacterium]|nr:MAG: hypothetical protein DLM70_19145 [Chloroflexota bacterium]